MSHALSPAMVSMVAPSPSGAITPETLAVAASLVADRLQAWLLKGLTNPAVNVTPHQYGLSFLRSALVKEKGSAAEIASVDRHLTKATTNDFACGEFLHYPHTIDAFANPQTKLSLPDWPLRFKNPDVANWQLLKLIVNFGRQKLNLRQVDQQIHAIARRYDWSDDGFLRDERGTVSFCYHAFSVSLLGDLADVGSSVAADWFGKAAETCKLSIAPTGQPALVGRGQEQIFAYGSTLAVLARRCAAGDGLAGNLFHLVLQRLASFQDEAGCLPLVLRQPPHGDAAAFTAAKLTDPAYAGWYAYNTPWDYQPFLLWQLRRCSEWLRTIAASNAKPAQSPSTSIARLPANLLVQRRDQHVLIAAAPTRGYWADGQPTPWVSDFPLPLCGVDHLAAKFDAAQLPLPGGQLQYLPAAQAAWIVKRKLVDRANRRRNAQPRPTRAFHFWQQLDWRLDGRLNGQLTSAPKLIGHCPLVEFERTYSWKAGELSLVDRITWKKSLRFKFFSPVRFAAAQFQTLAGGWEVTSRPNFEQVCQHGSLRIHASAVGVNKALQAYWTVKEIVTADGSAQLLSEVMEDYRVKAGDVLHRRMDLIWSPIESSSADPQQPAGYPRLFDQTALEQPGEQS